MVLSSWRVFLVVFLSAFAVGAAAESILVVGDSHSCGPFGARLVENLSQQGHDVQLYCAVSSAPSHWLSGKNPGGQTCQTMTSSAKKLRPCGGDGKVPKISDLLKQHRNAKVIAALGTNSLGGSKADASYRQMAEAIKAADHSCIWVGPPHLNAAESKGFPAGRVSALEKNLESFYDSLSVAVEGNCVLLDSRDVTASGRIGNKTTDGVHRNLAAGDAWAEFVAPAGTAASRREKSVK